MKITRFTIFASLTTVMLWGCSEVPADKPDPEPIPKVQVHIAFRVDRDLEGEPIRGSMGGLSGADAICQFYGQSVYKDETYRAFLAHGEPRYEDHGLEPGVSIQDRIEFKAPIVMYTSREEFVELVPEPSELWTDCDKLKDFLINVDRDSNYEVVDDDGFPWTGIMCDGSPAYLSCNAWKGSPPIDTANLDIDNIDLQTNYFLHQKLGTKGADPNSHDTCSSTGSIICISIPSP